MMSQKEIERELNFIETVGEKFGEIFGFIIKSPFRFFTFIFSFTVISLIAFFYSVKKGIEKS